MRSTLALSALLLASPAVLGDEPIESVCHLDGFETPVRCVTLEVPLDYSAPQAQTITIAAAVAPALTARPAPDPLFVFAGGPGQAGTGHWPLARDRVPAGAPRARRRAARLPRHRPLGRAALQFAGGFQRQRHRAHAASGRCVCGARRRGCAFLYSSRSRRGHRARAARARLRANQSMGRLVRHAHRTTLCARLRRPCAQRRARRRDAGRAVDLRVGAADRRKTRSSACSPIARAMRPVRTPSPRLRATFAELLARADSERDRRRDAPTRARGEPTHRRRSIATQSSICYAARFMPG